MNIDSHQHFWSFDPVRDTWITDEMSILKRDFLPDALIPQLRMNQMDGCVAVQVSQSEAETNFLLELASRFNEIAGVVGWIDLCSPDLPQRLKHFSQYDELRGFRHIVQSEPDDRFMLRKEFLAGIAVLQRFNFTYDILIYPRHLPAAIEMVERLPQQRFVLDHIAKPMIRSGVLSPWSEQIRILAASPNVYCKLSGIVTEADWKNWRTTDFRRYLDVVFDAFGPDRLMFGSDWPVCLLAGTYADVKGLISNYIRTLPIEQQHNIFGRNAARFYKLKTSRYEPATER